MKKGIVLEVDDDFVTLLTPDGEFVQIKKEGSYQIGQEIERIPMQRRKTKKTFFHFSSFKLAVASIAAVCLLVLSLFSSATSNEVYAYLSIDINPSIELTVNKKLEVINIRGYNQDGKKLVANLSDWKEKKFVDVTKKIIELCMKNGYLQEGEEVLITTVEKEANRSSSQRLTKELDEVKRSYQKQDIVVTTEKSTLELRKEAVEKGFTTGKYMRLTEKAKENNNRSNQNQKENVPVNRNQNEGNDNRSPQSSNLFKKEQEVQPKLNQQELPQLKREGHEEQVKMQKQVPSNKFVDKEEKNQEKRELKRQEIKEKREKKHEEQELKRKERQEKKREDREVKREKKKEEWRKKQEKEYEKECEKEYEREYEREYKEENERENDE
jgi:hypothetical protein